MTIEAIPEDLRRFVEENIESVSQLEALLLVRGESARVWSVEALAKRLFISESPTADAIARVRSGGLVDAHDEQRTQFFYSPRPELAPVVDRLADFYRKHLVSVTQLIHSHSKARAQMFADAFRLRRNE